MIGIEKTLLASGKSEDERIRVFQRKLFMRAKQDKGFRAHSLYGKICELETLQVAYRRVKSNYSTGVGVDGISFADIEKQGERAYLEGIRHSLQAKTYRSHGVRRVLIPKEKAGEFRKLGIPTIRDRIVQMAVKMVIEPLWESDFSPQSYGFRPKRSAQGAIRQIKRNIYQGHHFVYDADLSKYFDTIPHGKLFLLLKERLADGSILDLLCQWLKAPIKELDERWTKNESGTPQGGVISPLLSNIYLHAFDRIVNKANGRFARAGIRMVRYADDFVLMGKTYFSPSILAYIDRIMENMGLRLNKEKTRLLHVCKTPLHFLGFEFRYIRSKFRWNRKRYTNIRPSMKSRTKLFQALCSLLRQRRHWTIEWIVWKVNGLLRGWLNYFSIQGTSHIWDTVKVIKTHLDYKLFKWLKGKGRKAHRKLRQQPYRNLVKSYGLLDLEQYARLSSTAKAP